MKLKLVIVILLLYIGVASAFTSIDVNQSRCWEREGSSTAGYPDGTNTCETAFNVNSDNGLYETTNVGNNNYAELRTAHNFNSPNNCFLLGVEACVDFYTGNLDSCTGVQVTNDGGGSWSTSFGSCPTSDSGVVCYDVSGLRTWSSDCTDFSSNQAEIFIELGYKGNNQLLTDYVYYRVNYTIPPNITAVSTLPSGDLYSNDTLNCSAFVLDGDDTSITVNFTWYQNDVPNITYDIQEICTNNTLCNTSVIIPSSGLEIGHNWTCSVIPYDGYVYGEWRNSTTITVLNRAPQIDSLSINKGFNIDLLAGQNKTVSCNGSFTEVDGYTDINTLNATFFSSGTGTLLGDIDNRTNHYTNTSCSFTNNPGSSQDYNCSFSLDYYAVNGTWTCVVYIEDGAGDVHNLQDTIDINPMTAIGVASAVADFGKVQAMGTSPQVPLNVVNFGNIELDLNIFAYASNESDERAMNCTEGDIPFSNMRFNLTSGLTFSEMTPITGKSSPTFIEFDLFRRVWDGPESTKPTYWRVQVPFGSEGICYGKLVFSAIAS